MENPFRIVDSGDGPLQQGLESDTPCEVSPEEVYTLVRIQGMGEPGSMKAVLRMPGIWAPDVGTEVDLTEPPRSAQVLSQRYQISETGVVSLVVLTDPRSGWDDWAG